MRTALLLLCFLAAATRCFAWGKEGHEAIAALAQTMLSAPVLAKVQATLGTNEMASVALWADEARQLMRYHTGALVGNKEALDFVKKFPDNDQWHFANLPLDTFQYLPNGRFARTNDVIHSIESCVDVLEGHSERMTKPQALRYLIHLVGDLHQPLHVGCGYYRFIAPNTAVLVSDPSAISNLNSHDHGANMLWIDGRKDHPLHAFWDEKMVANVDKTPGNKKLLPILKAAVQKQKWKSKGPYHKWPERWAKDSVDEARGVYEGVHIVSGAFSKRGDVKGIEITLDSDYAAKEADRARAQLAKGAFHLAELLNRIHWE